MSGLVGHTMYGVLGAKAAAAAEEARFGAALLFIADAIAQMFADVVQRSPRLAKLPTGAGPSLDDLRKRWERK